MTPCCEEVCIVQLLKKIAFTSAKNDENSFVFSFKLTFGNLCLSQVTPLEMTQKLCLAPLQKPATALGQSNVNKPGR